MSGARAVADFNFTITIDNNSHITNGKEETGYFVNVTNIGTQQDTIVLSYEIINVTGGDEPDVREWYINLDKTQLTLLAGETGIVILTVDSSCGCQEGTVATVRVSGKSINEPTVTAYADTFTTRGPEIMEDALEIELNNTSVFLDLQAGQKLAFKLVIYNLQSNQNSYFITTYSKPAGWSVEYNQESVVVDSNSRVLFEVVLGLPEENEPGDFTLGFNIKSNRDPKIRDSLEIPLKLLPELSVESISAVGTEIYPDELVTLQVTLKNLGPAIARGFVVNLYNTSDIQVEPETHLITTLKFPSLAGGAEQVLNFSWYPNALGEKNITVFVNPDWSIEEFSNRYGNNILTKKIVVKSPDTSTDENDDADPDSNLGIMSAGLVAIIIIIILLVYFFKRGRNSNNEVRTAHKVPLSQRTYPTNRNLQRDGNKNKGRGRGDERISQKRAPGKTKKARKERI